MLEFGNIVTTNVVPYGTSDKKIEKKDFVCLFMQKKLYGAARHFWMPKVTDEIVLNTSHNFSVTNAYVQNPFNSIFNLKRSIDTLSYSCTLKNNEVIYSVELAPKTIEYMKYLTSTTEFFRNSDRVFLPLKLGTDIFIIAALSDIVFKHNYIEIRYDIEKWCLKRVTSDKDDIRRKIIDKAIELVNQSFNSSDKLTSLFKHNDYGWNVPVVLDFEDDYERRKAKRKLELERVYLNNNVLKPFDSIDILGEYYSVPGYIKLYVKAIEEFISDIGIISPSTPEHIYAYILAHEIFHAYQDFHVNLKKDICGENVEYSAEYYALRFVDNFLGDNALYKELCDNRRNNYLYPYSDALTHYGDINNPNSETLFLDFVNKWI